MEREKLDNLVEEVIGDLKSKIETISAAAETPDIMIRVQLQEARDKAVAVLEKAVNAIGNACQGEYDPKQIVEGLKVAIDRSQDLFDQTMRQINEIKGLNADDPEKTDPFPILPNEEEETVQETPFAEEEPSQENEAEESTDEVSAMAREVLESWIAPEGEDK